MLKRFGIPALALASVLAMAAPNVTLAAERGGNRSGREVARQDFRGRGNDHFDRDRHFDRDDRGRFNFGVGFYANPAPQVPVPVPAPAGYYDQFGIWHPYAY